MVEVVTRDLGIVNELGTMLADGTDAPELRDGEEYALRLTSDGRLTLEVREDDGHLFWGRFAPAPLSRHFDERLGVAGGLIRGALFTALASTRMEPRQVGRVIGATWKFPEQIESLLLVAVTVTPQPASWLDGVVAGLEVDPRGAPMLRSPRSTVSVSVAAQGEGLDRLLAPFLDHVVTVRGRTRAERKAFAAVLEARRSLVSGRYAMMIDGPGRYVELVGLADPQRYREHARTEAAALFDRSRHGRFRVDYRAPEAEQLAAFDVAEEVAPSPRPSELATFRTVAGEYRLKARLPKDGDDLARWIERLEAGRPPAVRLPSEALAIVEVDFRSFQLDITELVPDELELQLPVDPAEISKQLHDMLPELATLSVHKVENEQGREQLRLRVVTRN